MSHDQLTINQIYLIDQLDKLMYQAPKVKVFDPKLATLGGDPPIPDESNDGGYSS